MKEEPKDLLKRDFLQKAVIVGLAVVIDLILLDTIFAPMHASGKAQALCAPLCKIGHLLELPGMLWMTLLVGKEAYHPDGWGFSLQTGFSGLFFAAVTLALLSSKDLLKRRRSSRFARVPESSFPTRGNMSRRDFLKKGKWLGYGLVGGTVGWGGLIEPNRLTVSQQRFKLRDLAPSLCGLKVVQLSDIHHGPWTSVEWIRGWVERVNELSPDLILMTGDYVRRSSAYIEPVMRELARLKPSIGTVAVLGNHDWYEDVSKTRRELSKIGVPLIDNGRIFLTLERRLTGVSDHGLCIAGVGDLWEDRVDVEAALGGVPDDLPRLLLSHNPDVAEDPRLKAHRIDLMLCGHTHGGQVRLPLIGSPMIPSRYGQKYAQGLVQGPVCPVFICRGIGMTILPVRLGVPPEIAMFELIG